MIYYLLISIAALMFSFQFICQQSYEKNCGTAIPQAILYYILVFVLNATGGVMLFSVIISTLKRENIRKIEYISAITAFVASVFMAF